MAIGEHKNWRELCHAALEAKDPNELLEIVQELNKALKHEEQVRRDFREASQDSEQVVRRRPRPIIVGERRDPQMFQTPRRRTIYRATRGSLPGNNL